MELHTKQLQIGSAVAAQLWARPHTSRNAYRAKALLY